jgi:hypothetical protein
VWERTSSFWAERDAWARAVEGRQAAGSGRRSLTLTHKKQRWTLRAAHYTRNFPHAANALIQVDADYSKSLLTILAGLDSGLAEAADAEYSAVMEAAFANWPVSTGLSKSLLDIAYDQSGDTLITELRCGAPYAIFIAGKPANRWIKLPGIEAGKRVATRGLSAVSAGA